MANTKDWRNLPLDKWNTLTVHTFMIEKTEELYKAPYTPNGKGSISQRWRAEQSMIKQAIQNHGADVVKKFIELCWANYYPSDKAKYPYPTFGFMVGYMDRYWTEAYREVEKDKERNQAAEESDANDIDVDWF